MGPHAALTFHARYVTQPVREQVPLYYYWSMEDHQMMIVRRTFFFFLASRRTLCVATVLTFLHVPVTL